MADHPLRVRALVTALVLVVCAAAIPAWAQEAVPPPANAFFLFINQEQLLIGSEAGKELLAAEEEERRKLVAEARAIDAAFEEEERQLTEKRGTIPPEEFRKLADNFDKRVVQARQTQDERSDMLAQELERSRRQFYAAVAPVLVRLMERYGAQAIFDENSVLFADQRLNITDAVIAEIDAGHVQGLPEAASPENENSKDTQP